MNDADEWEDAEVTFAGLRPNNNKLAICCILPDGDTGFFTNPKIVQAWKNSVIGGIYKIKRRRENHNSFSLGNPRFLRRSDDPRAPAWVTEHEVARVDDRRRKMAEKAKDDEKRLLIDALAPFRALYHATDFHGKLAIEVLLLSYLRR